MSYIQCADCTSLGLIFTTRGGANTLETTCSYPAPETVTFVCQVNSVLKACKVGPRVENERTRRGIFEAEWDS